MKGSNSAGGDEEYYKNEMLVAVQAGDEERLKGALEHMKLNTDAVNSSFLECNIPGATALHIATQNSSLDLVILLLEAGANTNIKVQKGKKYTALHYASINGNPQILRSLLNKGADPNIREEEMGRTALHLLANSWKKDEEGRYRECLDALLKCNKILVDSPDTKKATPIFLSANKNWEYMTKRLVEKGANLAYKIGRKTIEEIINRNFPGLLDSVDLSTVETPTRSYGDELFHCLYERDLTQFRNLLNELSNQEQKVKEGALGGRSGRYTMLGYACENGLTDFVHELANAGACKIELGSALQAKVEPTQVPEISPVLYAARNGYFKILEILLRALKDARVLDKVLKGVDGKSETALHKVVKREFEGADRGVRGDHGTRGGNMADMEGDGEIVSSPVAPVSYEQCLELLLSDRYRKYIEIDAQDIFGNTPLHYAVLSEDQIFVRTLLLNGAHLGIKNRFGTLAITRIGPGILEEVLNDSIKHNKSLTDKDFEIIMNYTLLAPQKSSFRPETECLKYLSLSRKHRRLLLHPIIDTFLTLKWQRIKPYFVFNISVYTIFVLLLTIYILSYHGATTTVIPTTDRPATNNTTTTTTDSSNLPLKYLLQASISILLTYLVIREGIQFIVNWRNYIKQLENWLELSIIILTIILFVVPGYGSVVQGSGTDEMTPENSITGTPAPEMAPRDDETNTLARNMAPGNGIGAWLILFSWIEFVLLLGRHPYFSIYVTMFTTVAQNFLKFILMFLTIILAFFMSFFLLFKSDPNFGSYPNALLKTVAMTTGELEYTDLPLDDYPIASHLFFIIFVFLIVLVLMNLLNGLAVSDIQEIREEAELVSYSSRVELIGYIESVFLATPLKRMVPLGCKGIREEGEGENRQDGGEGPERNRGILGGGWLLNWLGRRIFMFQKCLSQNEPQIKLYPNRETGRIEVCTCHRFALEEWQIEAAKDVVLGRAHAVTHHRFSGIEQRMDDILKSLNDLTEKVNKHVLVPTPE